MQVFVKSFTSQTKSFFMNPDEEISVLRKKISEKESINKDCFNIFFEGKSLQDETTFVDNGIDNLSTIQVSVGLLGGKKKKKKKKGFASKKKNKHRHKSVKLHTLQYYSINDDNTVQRLRKYSPEFGPGTWLAKHTDRYHCGKSGKCFRIDDDELENK